MFNTDITRSSSAIAAGILAEGCPSKYANRLGCLSKAPRSRPHSIFRISRRRRATSSEVRERTVVPGVVVEITLYRQQRLLEMVRPTLRDGSCAFPRVQ